MTSVTGPPGQFLKNKPGVGAWKPIGLTKGLQCRSEPSVGIAGSSVQNPH